MPCAGLRHMTAPKTAIPSQMCPQIPYRYKSQTNRQVQTRNEESREKRKRSSAGVPSLVFTLPVSPDFSYPEPHSVFRFPFPLPPPPLSPYSEPLVRCASTRMRLSTLICGSLCGAERRSTPYTDGYCSPHNLTQISNFVYKIERMRVRPGQPSNATSLVCIVHTS